MYDYQLQREMTNCNLSKIFCTLRLTKLKKVESKYRKNSLNKLAYESYSH